MKIVKNKAGRYFLELNETEEISVKRNFFGQYVGATIPIENLAGMMLSSPSPALEDLVFLGNSILQERDRQMINKTLGEDSKHE